MGANEREWPKISGGTLADRVYRVLRDQLLEGSVQPGEFIREVDASEALGVSRTPVREALGRLASEGFVEKIAHRGFRVPDEPVARLLELYPIVAALELLAGRLAFPRLAEGDLAELQGLNATLESALAGGDVERAIQANSRFHAAIVERSGNRRLAELLEDLRSQLHGLEAWYYSYPERGEESVEEHATMIARLEAGDIEAALGILKGNMRLTEAALREEFGDPER